MGRQIKLFLDTANLKDIKKGIALGLFSGVTTNPVLLAKESLDYKKHVLDILGLLPPDWELSLEVKAGSRDDLVKQAKTASDWDKRIRVKIPVNRNGLMAAAQLMGAIKLNLTVVKSSAQAMLGQVLAAKGSPLDVVISVFCGRISQAGYDWKIIIKELSSVEWPGKLLAASIKTPLDISDAIANGANIVTAPLDVYETVLDSKLVAEDVDNFNRPFDDKNFNII